MFGGGGGDASRVPEKTVTGEKIRLRSMTIEGEVSLPLNISPKIGHKRGVYIGPCRPFTFNLAWVTMAPASPSSTEDPTQSGLDTEDIVTIAFFALVGIPFVIAPLMVCIIRLSWEMNVRAAAQIQPELSWLEQLPGRPHNIGMEEIE